jgi:hypothetical protein
VYMLTKQGACRRPPRATLRDLGDGLGRTAPVQLGALPGPCAASRA